MLAKQLRSERTTPLIYPPLAPCLAEPSRTLVPALALAFLICGQLYVPQYDSLITLLQYHEYIYRNTP